MYTEETKQLLMDAAGVMGKEDFGWGNPGNLCIDPVEYTPWNPLTSGADRDEIICKMPFSIGRIDSSVAIFASGSQLSMAIFADHASVEEALGYALCKALVAYGKES